MLEPSTGRQVLVNVILDHVMDEKLTGPVSLTQDELVYCILAQRIPCIFSGIVFTECLVKRAPLFFIKAVIY